MTTTPCLTSSSGRTPSRHDIFDFILDNNFKGEFTVFAGLEDCLRFVENFKFSKSDIDYLKSALSPNIDPQFFVYLEGLDCKGMRIDAIPEGLFRHHKK